MRSPQLDVRGIHKKFSDRDHTIEVIRDISFQVKTGEFLSVIGPSGCGKSTLFNIIAGLEPADAGDVSVNGQQVNGHTESFAYMPQQDLLFPWRSVLANTTLGLEIQGVPLPEARQRAGALFEHFGLAGFENRYPHTLSGGMRQRAALLRTVVQQRPILLLDEPFGALDALTRMQMQEWLASMSTDDGWTVLLVTHDIREAVMLSDRIVVLTQRPTVIAATFPVPLPRPRRLEVIADPVFVQLEMSVLRALQPANPL